MKSRAIVRLLGCAFVVVLAACAGGTGPPPPPPGAPVVTAGANGSLPVATTFNLSATFTDTTSNGAPWTYGIDWGDGNTASGTKSTITPITATHTFASEGTYHVKVTVTNKGGKSGDGRFTVTATAPVLLAAGDIADCTRSGDDATANLLDGLQGIVVPLGDNAYLNGTPTEYADCYAPTWGRHKARTRPVAGNHDYYTANAAGYFGYFGAAAGDPTKGYYTYTLGSWFVIVLNTGTERPINYEAGSAQELWLRNELATHSQQCVLAMWHHARFSTVLDRPAMRPEVKALWDALYEYGADLVLNGHDHAYQRYAPQTPDGVADAAFGIRQIINGTGGGEGLYEFGPIQSGSNLQVRNNETWGVLKVTLRTGRYDWQYIPVTGQTFTDSGSGTCHGRPM